VGFVNGGDEGYRVRVLCEERLLKLNPACSRTIQNAAASRGAGRITVDAREKG